MLCRWTPPLAAQWRFWEGLLPPVGGINERGGTAVADS